MSTVNVLVIVNVQQALGSIGAGNQNIGQWVYMVDSTGYFRNGQGGNELVTTVISGDELIWQVTPIDPSETVVINNFSGQAIGTNPANGQIVNPAQYQQYNPTGSVWGGYVTSTSNGQVQYTLQLQFANGDTGWFDPYLVSNAPQ